MIKNWVSIALKVILLVCVGVSGARAWGQTGAITGFCTLGASKAMTSGLPSSNFAQGLVPSCLVTVYQTGTTNLASIFKDGVGTIQTNPFTANSAGEWLFYAAVNQGYDVVLSGGISPNTYPSPKTLVGLYPATNVIAASTPAGPAFAVNFANSLVNAFQGDSAITINPTTHVFTAPSVVLTGLSGALPVCPNGAGGALTTSGCTAGIAANPAGPAFAVNFANSSATLFQGDSKVTINPTAHAFAALINSGFTYAVQNQTGSGSNGIVNSIAYGQTVVADPSYVATTTANMTQGSTAITVTSATGIINGQYVSGNVPALTTVTNVSGNNITLSASALTTNAAATVNFFEFPYTLRSTFNVPPVSNGAFVDNLLGRSFNLKRDAPQDPLTGGQDYNVEGCVSTKLQGWTTTTSTGGAGSNQACHFTSVWYAAPQANYGTTATGHSPSNWGITIAQNITDTISTRGIANGIGGLHAKSGIGDGPSAYYYYADYLGSVAGSDEGQGGQFTQGGEANTTFAGTVSTGGGGTGATSLSVTCVTDCIASGNLFSAGPGDGRYMVDKTGGIAFNMISRTAPSGQNPGTITTDTSFGVSTFWGTLSGDVVTPPPVNASGIPFSNQNPAVTQTFTVAAGTLNGNVNPGAPAPGDLICFSWPYHEQAKITSVSGSGPWSVTAPLRMPHTNGSWMFSNGTCGSFMNFTANDIPVNGPDPGVILHYPIDVIGSTTANTLVYVYFNTSSVNVGSPGAFPLGNMIFANVLGTSTATNSGGVVTLGPSPISYSTNPYYFNVSSIQITNATNSAYNGACTNTVAEATGKLTCYQAGSIGQAATTGLTISLGTSGYGNTAGFLWQGAEVLDILDYNQTNCAATTSKNAPCFDSKNIVLEPNGAAWANGDSVEQPHHYAKQLKMRKDILYNYSPYQMLADGAYNVSLIGPGVCCGAPSNLTQNWAAIILGNANNGTFYAGHGNGTLTPPGGINLGSGSSTTGVGYNYGLNMERAPEPNAQGTAIYVGCPASPFLCTDRTYSYQIFAATGNNNVSGGPPNTANWMTFKPFFNEISIGNGASPIVWNGEMNGTTNRDTLKFAAMVQPTVTLSASTTGGQLADGTYCYYIIARNTATFTPPPAENCAGGTITGGGGNGSIKLTWTRSSGATSYYVCGRTTGAELQVVNVGGVDGTFFTDTGGATPTGSCAFTTTAANGNVDQAGQLGINSLGTAFEDILKATAGLAANVTHTFPPTGGTVGLGLTIPAGTATFAPGTNVTSCGCAASYTCTNTRGRLTIVGGTATTGTICTVTWSASLTTAPFFTLGEMGATSLHGLDHGVPSAASVTITAAVSVSGATVTMDYETQP